MPDNCVVKKIKQILIKSFFYLFLFCFSIVKITAQPTYAFITVNDKVKLHKHLTSHNFSVSELQNGGLNNYSKSNRSFVLKNNKTMPMINTKFLRYRNMISLDITGEQGALIAGVIGSLLGFYAVSMHAHPDVPTSTKIYGAFSGGVAFAPLGYIICDGF